ncbi:heme-binding protein 1 [Trichonephila inaurata madagascariensis]|uniref:Heme-binding protein 1 n=1 Tax=Trichonephila inaurata madagascariensis TaxID=2747483 RepID=A0A8X6WW39_9ARAC|nr:heme-binding protein 1 [Trichonephila inaurata madagascariensis]
MKSLVVVAVVALFAVAESCERHGAQCPVYTVVQSNKDYEVREYPSLVWVSISGNGKSKSDVSRKLIKQLYSYLGGANDRGMTLDMMVPVRTKKVVNEGYNTYTMAVLLKPQDSENPPKPENALLSVNREPPTTYIVKSFDGYARQDSIWDEHSAALKEALPSNEVADASFYYMSVYDSPWRETDRLNEVWLEKVSN